MNKRALIIIDIQPDYAEYFSYSYLKTIYSFLNKNKGNYEKVYMLYEPTYKVGNNPIDGISFIAKDTISVCKLYSTTHDEKITGLDSQEKIIEMFKEKNTNSIVYSEGELMLHEEYYSTYDDNRVETKRVMYRVDFISNEMRKMIEEIKKTGYEVDLIGGGLTKCVKITKEILNKKDINTNVLEDYCYHIRFVNSNRHPNIMNKKPPKGYFRKEFIDEDGFLKIVKLPNSIIQ